MMRDGIIAAVGGAPVRPVCGPWGGVVACPAHNGPPGSPMATCGQIWPDAPTPNRHETRHVATARGAHLVPTTQEEKCATFWRRITY